MQTPETVQHRSSPIRSVEKRRAIETLKPFVGALSGWNSKAAFLKSRAESPYSSDEDRTLARLECGGLLAEVRHRHIEFRSAVKGEPQHSRLDDVDAAFQRLADQLQSMSDFEPRKH